MKKKHLRILASLSIILICLLLLAMRDILCPIDPHAGYIYVFDGTTWVWISPLQGVPKNPFRAEDFDTSGELRYVGSKFNALRGIDISQHQGNINWKLVAESGIDCAIIRVGFRGSTKGTLYEDDYFRRNIEGALANGLKVGVYIFSQAINVPEALQEAEFTIERIREYDISMPVYFDWETLAGGGNRTDVLKTSILNDCAVAFCEKIRSAGYTPGIYFNQHQGYFNYDLSRMQTYNLWVADYEGWPDFYYAIDACQYSASGEVPGIHPSGNVDMDIFFQPKS